MEEQNKNIMSIESEQFCKLHRWGKLTLSEGVSVGLSVGLSVGCEKEWKNKHELSRKEFLHSDWQATYTIGGTICGAERCRHRGRFPRRPFVAMYGKVIIEWGSLLQHSKTSRTHPLTSGRPSGSRGISGFPAQTSRRIVRSFAHCSLYPFITRRNSGEDPRHDAAADAPAHDANYYITVGSINIPDN